MSYNPYARYRYGGELYHGRKKISEGGARNGYSNTPGYIAKGKKSPGVWINGKLVYPDQQSMVDAKVKSYLNNQKAADAKADYFMSTKIGKSTLPKDAILYRTIDQKGVVNPKNTLDKALGKNFVRTNIRSGEASRRRQEYNRSKRQLGQQRQAMTLNKQNQGIGGLLRRTANTVGKTAGNAGNWLRGRANDVGKAAGSAGNWLRGRANDVGKAARGAAKNAYNAIGKAWDGKAGKGTAKDDAVAYNKYANQFGPKQAESRKLDTRLAYLRAARGANYDYDNSIKGRLESAGRAVSKAANSAGNWLNDRRRDVGNAVNNIRDEVEYAWDGKIGKGTARDYAARNDDGTPGRSYAYDNSIRGRLENAGKAVSKAARGASKYVSDRAEDVGRAARGAARNAAGAVGGAANRVRRAAEEAWDGKAGKGTARDMAEKFNGPAKNEYNRKYDRSIKGTAERVGKAIGGAAGKARDTIGGVAKSVSEKASERMKEAGDFISTTVKNASSTIDKATKPVRDNVSKAVSNKDEYNRMVRLGSYYDADTNQWASPEAKQNYESAKRSYEQHLLTQAGKLGKEAKQTVNKMLKDAKTTGSNAVGKVVSAYSDIESYIKRLSKGKK